MTLKRALALSVLAPWLQAQAQPQQATEQSIHGKWFVTGSSTEQSMTFAAGGDLYLVAVRKRKDLPPLSEKTEGAYTIAPGACAVSPNQGNLWIVKDSARCCFKAYHLGKTLVLDEVQGSAITASPLDGSLCAKKTLRRNASVLRD